MEVVNCFTYLGLSLSMQLSFNRMADELAMKGKRVLISLLHSLYNLGQMPKSVFFTLFDRKIAPVLLYGSEIWGFSKRESTELVHRYACKRYMCVSLHSSNMAVLGDCGRFPLWIEAARRCVKYWLRIMSMDDSRYVRKCYNTLKVLDDYGKTNWVSNVRLLLQSNGFGYVWTNQSVTNPHSFISVFTQRLKDQFIQTWNTEVVDNSKLILYKDFKTDFEHKRYFNCLQIRCFRHALARIRTCSHNLEIEVGRHSGCPRAERICKLCRLDIEDEAHFIIYCPVLHGLREKYLPNKFH